MTENPIESRELIRKSGAKRRNGKRDALWRDLVHYALIVGATEDGGAVEVFAGFVEDYGAVGLGSVVLVGEAVEDAIGPFAIRAGSQFVNHAAAARARLDTARRRAV